MPKEFVQASIGLTTLFPGRHENEYWGNSGHELIHIQGKDITRYLDPEKRFNNAFPFIDREGNLWLVTGDSGVFRLRSQKISNVELKGTFRGQNIAPRMVVPDSIGNVHVASWAHVSRIDGVEVEDLSLEGELNRQWGVSTSFSMNQYLRHGCLTFDPVDEFIRWVGLGNIDFDRGNIGEKFGVERGRRVPLLARVSGDSTQFFDHESHPLGVGHAYAVEATSSETVWVGTDQGVFKLEAGELTYWHDIVDLAPFSVMTIMEDRAERILIGGDDSGLIIVEKNQPIRVLRQKDGLSTNNVLSLYQDREGVIWIGSDKGLTRLDGDELQPFTDGAEFLSSEVVATIEDHLGNLWFGTDTGIFSVRGSAFDEYLDGGIDELGALKFGLPDGMRNEGVYPWCTPSAARTPDNQLWFCTQVNMVRFDPERLLSTVVPPVVDITGCSQPNGSFLDRSLDLGLYDGRKLNLPPEAQDVLFFDYAARVFSYPDKVRHQYRLKGVFDEWRNAGSQQRAMFTKLAPGHYTFEVRAINHNDAVSPRVATLPIYLAPYYYQTLWFRGGVTLAVLGAAFGFYRWRMSYQNRIRALEQKVEMNSERSRIARDMHDEIGSSLAQMRLLGELAGDLETQNEEGGQLASQIERLAVNSSRSLREIIWSLNPEKSSVEDLAEYLDLLVRDFFNGTGIQAEVVSEKGTLVELSPEFRRQIVLICKGAMSNALKHSKADRFFLKIQSERAELILVFKDNGIGFDPNQIPVDSHGLQSIRERAEQLGGQVKISPTLGKGTVIRISAPLKPSACGAPS